MARKPPDPITPRMMRAYMCKRKRRTTHVQAQGAGTKTHLKSRKAKRKKNTEIER